MGGGGTHFYGYLQAPSFYFKGALDCWDIDKIESLIFITSSHFTLQLLQPAHKLTCETHRTS